MSLKTKYLKIICNFLAAGLLLFFIVFFVPKLLVYFMPFVIGIIFALIANPMVKFLEKHIKINRKFGSVLMIGLVIGVVALACYEGVTLLARGLGGFMEYLPTMTVNAGNELAKAMEQLQAVLEKLPFMQDVDLSALGKMLQDFLTGLVSGSDSFTITRISDFAKSLPDVLVSVVVGLLAAYFFIADKDKLIHGIEKHLSEDFMKKTRHIYGQLVNVVGGYFKAQFKIMGVIYIVVFIGLLILRVDFAWLIAFGIAFLDMLPVFGTGTVLCPWAVIKFFSGNYTMAAGMLILYVVTLVMHQVVQPKLIGDSVGMDAFAALFFMYIGYRISNVVGMILAIPIGMILINLYDAGAFDTLVWCVKETVKDFNNFRRVDTGKKETDEPEKKKEN